MPRWPYLSSAALREVIARCEQRLAREREDWRRVIRWGLEWSAWAAIGAREHEPLPTLGDLRSEPAPSPDGGRLTPRVHGAGAAMDGLLDRATEGSDGVNHSWPGGPRFTT